MRLVLSLVMLTLILVACGGADQSAQPISEVSSDATYTPTPEGYIDPNVTPIETQEVDEEGNFILVTPQAQVLENVVPLPGTLAFDSEFVDEDMGAVFDRIVFVRSGGSENAPTYLLKLNQDGTYELNQEILGQVDPATVTRIDDMLDEMNFFGINTPMLGPGTESDNYRYSITVERGTNEMTLRAEDGFTPQSVMRLFGALLGIIADSENTAISTPVSGA